MIATAQQFVDLARSWVGVPFQHQGRTRRGTDCVGLVIVVARELGLIPKDFERRDYGRLPTRGELEAKLQQHLAPADRPIPGSIVAIRWNASIAHVAVCTGGTLIHAYEKVGRVVEHGFRGRWVRMVDSTWLVPGVTYE
ncbi:MAG TPA: NlpC/P60 family protein [Mycolicibacterium fallax]|nr:NlpC/P60 family protein [Mycolicibacterium fallax]